MANADAKAVMFGHNHVDLHHMLLALVEQGGNAAGTTLRTCGVESKDLYQKLTLFDPIKPARVKTGKLSLTPDATKAIYLAIDEAQTFHRKIVNCNHLFLGILRVNNGIARSVFESFGLDCLTVYKSVRTNGVKKSSSIPRPAIS